MLRSWVFCHLAADMLTAIRTIMLVSGDLTYFVHPFCLLVFFLFQSILKQGDYFHLHHEANLRISRPKKAYQTLPFYKSDQSVNQQNKHAIGMRAVTMTTSLGP